VRRLFFRFVCGTESGLQARPPILFFFNHLQTFDGPVTSKARSYLSAQEFCLGFVMTDAMLRANGYFIGVEPLAAHKFITESIEKREFRFDVIHVWLARHARPL